MEAQIHGGALQRKVSESALNKPSSSSSRSSSSLFRTAKKDKRQIKHAVLMGSVTQASSTPRRHRRPNKKLVATLDSLAAALPEEEVPGKREISGCKIADRVNIIRRTSIKSRPGAMKRRQKLDQGERERFAKNMVQMAVSKAPVETGSTSQNGGTSMRATTSERWAALRGFISQTLEQKPEML